MKQEQDTGEPDTGPRQHDEPLEDWTGELSKRPGHLIRRCHQIQMALYARATGSLGVTPLQYAVLRTISQHPRRSKRRLGEMAGLDRTTVSWIIVNLQNKELIAPTADSLHSRIRYFELTPLGSEMLAKLDPPLNAMQDLILEPLSPAERRAFLKSMQKIVAAYNHLSRAPMRGDSDEE